MPNYFQLTDLLTDFFKSVTLQSYVATDPYHNRATRNSYTPIQCLIGLVYREFRVTPKPVFNYWLTLATAKVYGVFMDFGKDFSLQYPVEWVTIDKCSELVGLSKDAINAHRVKGNLRIDVHWTKCKGRVFINMPAFQRWISTGH